MQIFILLRSRTHDKLGYHNLLLEKASAKCPQKKKEKRKTLRELKLECNKEIISFVD